MNWKRALIPVAIILPFLIILAMGFGTDPHALPSVLEGRPAPSFTLMGMDGKTVSSTSLKGKPYILNFWSTWCVPCKYEHPILQAAAQRYQGQVEFIGVVYQDDPQVVRRYLSGQQNIYRQLLDPNSRTAIEFGVSGVPESFFVDARGIVRHKQPGVVNAALIENFVRQMLTETTVIAKPPKPTGSSTNSQKEHTSVTP